MDQATNLYFIALVLPASLSSQITVFKEDFALRFDSRAALKVIPHITVKTPFKIPIQSHDELIQWFQQMQLPKEPFEVMLKDFDCFPNTMSPVIFVNPTPNTPLHVLQNTVVQSFSMHFPTLVHPLDKKYHPHITVAYRDLQPDKFQEAWTEYQHKKFEASFLVNAVFLLQHDRQKWNIIASSPLQKD